MMKEKTPWTKLKELRKSAGLTREALSALSGVGAQQIYRLESGEVPRDNAGLGTVRSLAGALGVTLDYLLQDHTARPETMFVRKIARLQDRDLTYLRHEAGQPMSEARTANAYRVFYALLPPDAVPADADENDAEDLTERW